MKISEPVLVAADQKKNANVYMVPSKGGGYEAEGDDSVVFAADG